VWTPQAAGTILFTDSLSDDLAAGTILFIDSLSEDLAAGTILFTDSLSDDLAAGTIRFIDSLSEDLAAGTILIFAARARNCFDWLLTSGSRPSQPLSDSFDCVAGAVADCLQFASSRSPCLACAHVCLRIYRLANAIITKSFIMVASGPAVIPFAEIPMIAVRKQTWSDEGGLVPPGHIVQTAADDDCMAHALLAGRNPVAYAKGRAKTGWTVGDHDRVRADAALAKALRLEIAETALQTGDAEAHERLKHLGSAGWLEDSDVFHYASKAKVRIQITELCSPTAVDRTIGSGPLAMVLAHVASTDGSGKMPVVNHWVLAQAWPIPERHLGDGSEPAAKRQRHSAGLDVEDDDVDPVDFWEPDEFKELHDEEFDLKVDVDVDADPLDFALHLKKVFEDVELAENNVWSEDVPDMLGVTLRLVGLRLATFAQWDSRSDLLVARVMACIFRHHLRAHATGVYLYRNGAWMPLEKMPPSMMMRAEETLARAQIVFVNLQESHAGSTLEQLFEMVKEMDLSGEQGLLQSDLRITKATDSTQKKWWANAAEAIGAVSLRFQAAAGRQKASAALEVYGTYMMTELPPVNNFINFQDCAFIVHPDEAAGDRLEQKNKTPENDCYIHMPCSLAYKPSDANVERLRRFMATTFAGHPESRLIDASMEALCLFGRPMPHRIVILMGPGGDGKSLRSMLRHNMFGTGHRFMNPQALQKDDEFRLQGSQFGNVKAVTIQECKGGAPLIEDVFKLFIDGGLLGCRPNYGEETKYLSWAHTGKYWETNLILPSIHGNPEDIKKLKSWWRRILVCHIDSAYTANPAEINARERVFAEDCSLPTFLQSCEARFIYTTKYLMRFIRKNSAEKCISNLQSPPQIVKDDSIKAVQQMANGGLRPFEAYADIAHTSGMPADETGAAFIPGNESGKLVKEMYAKYVDKCTVPDWQIAKATFIKAAKIRGSRGNATRQETFAAAAELVPWLFQRNDAKRCFFKLNIDVEKVHKLMQNIGSNILGGPDHWKRVWDLKASFGTYVADNEQATDFKGAGDTDAGMLAETVNLTALKVYAAVGTDKRQRQLERYIAHCESTGVIQGDFCTTEVHYYRKYGLPGLRYASGPALQKLSVEARAAAMLSHAFDVDQVNAVPECFQRCLLRHHCDVDKEYPLRTSYVKSRSAWLGFLSEYKGYSQADAKHEILKLHYGGKPSADLPMLWAYVGETETARAELLGMEEYAYLSDKFNDRRSPLASKLSYALAAEQDCALQKLENYLAMNCKGIKIHAYMFDGCIVSFPGEPDLSAQKGRLDSCCVKFGSTEGIPMKIKDW
jgi:hypothetical protein